MFRILPCLGLAALLGGCAVYPNGAIGPLPPVAPAGVYAPPPPVAYAPPAYGYAPAEGAPVYYVPPPPVVVAPSVGIGLSWGSGWGYYGGPRGYWGRPYYRGRHW